MRRYYRRVGGLLLTACVILLVSTVFVAPSRGIEAGMVDDFQDATNQGWIVGYFAPTPIPVTSDAGPNGLDDYALHMDTATVGSGRLLALNASQWTGDWTAAGINQISFDVRNPNEFALTMRLGVAGPGGAGGGGSGDTYVTSNGISVPSDDSWHNVVFDVLPSDFVTTGGSDIDTALSDVSHFRIINNANPFFIGEFGGEFYLDNITAIGATTGILGDYNGNDVVDAADYVVWRTNPASLINEGASPNVVDEDDYAFWRSRFGATDNLGVGAGTIGVLESAAVPEPASWLFMWGLFVFSWVVVRRRA
jgi:hypothetical protein